MALLHDLSLYLLYASLAVAAYLAIERSIFFFTATSELQRMHRSLASGLAMPAFRAGGVGDELVKAYSGKASQMSTREGEEDRAEKAYIRVQHHLTRHLWILDTIVTAAPLLGLLGTILGIFDTFTVLAKSGISDPQGVSAGIGTALLATAVGIGTALACVVVYNGFMARVERLGDETKLALLELSGTKAT